MDTSVVDRARAGDREAFATLARAALPWMDGVARLTLRDPELARDAVQEALVRAWKSLPGLRNPEQFQAWLRRLVVRACIDELRRSHGRHRVEVSLTDLHHPEMIDSSLTSADRDALERAFRRLSVEHRAVFVLHHHQGLPLVEIAESLGIPAGTARSRLHYATKVLRAAIDADDRGLVANEGRMA